MRPSLGARQSGKKSMNESTVVSVECLDVRGLGFDRSDAASSFVLQMSLVQKSGKCVSHKTSPLPLGDGRMRSFMEPRTAGKRQVLTTEEVLDDDVAVRFEVLERRSPRRPSSRFSSSPPRPVTTVVGTVEVVPWLATTSGPSHRWLRLQDASGRKLRTELRARATVLLGTGNALSDVHAVVDDMTWFRQNVCTKPKNVVKVAVVRSRKPFSNQRPCFVEVTSSAAARGGGQDQEEEERGTILLKSCARTAPSASGLFLEVLTVKLEESIRIRVVDTQGVAPGDVTLRVNDLSETPQWLQAGPLGLLVAARRDYDEQCDDYAGRPFFDDDEVLDVSEKTRPPPNVLRVVVARARGPYFAAAAEKSSFTATVRVGADELSTRAVPSTAEACVWDECFEFPFPKTTKTTTTTTEEDTARRVSVASTVEKLSRRPKSLLPGVDSDDDDSDDDDSDDQDHASSELDAVVSRQLDPFKERACDEEPGISGVNWCGDSILANYRGDDVFAFETRGTAKPVRFAGRRNVQTCAKEVRWLFDGACVATGGDDGCLYVWNRAGKPLAKIRTDRNVLNSLAPRPRSSVLATSGVDAEVKILDCSGSSLCSAPTTKRRRLRVQRDPPPATFFHDFPPPRPDPPDYFRAKTEAPSCKALVKKGCERRFHRDVEAVDSDSSADSENSEELDAGGAWERRLACKPKSVTARGARDALDAAVSMKRQADAFVARGSKTAALRAYDAAMDATAFAPPSLSCARERRDLRNACDYETAKLLLRRTSDDDDDKKTAVAAARRLVERAFRRGLRHEQIPAFEGFLDDLDADDSSQVHFAATVLLPAGAAAATTDDALVDGALVTHADGALVTHADGALVTHASC